MQEGPVAAAMPEPSGSERGGAASAPQPISPHTLGGRIAELLRRDFLVGGISPTYYLTRWIFLRLLGVVHLIAFTSLWWQVDGLIGSNGITPVQFFLKTIVDRTGSTQFLRVPSLCWFIDSDWFLYALCAVGTLAALVLIADFAPAICMGILFTCYLSLVSVTPDFLGFQWDTLLLETTFLAILFAPAKLMPGIRREEVHSRISLMLLRWLLFRLLFMSGWVKLMDGTWQDLSALGYHYETQPLPHAFSWYVHQLPLWVDRLSVVLTFGVELVLPLLFVAPRRVRAVVCILIILFQLIIAATGNYTFFNMLTIALCLLLLDDRHWQYLVPSRLQAFLARPPLKRLPIYRKLVIGGIGLFLVVVTGLQMCMVLRLNVPFWAHDLVFYTDSYHVSNRYGLFAHMTTSRQEIIVEGSDDGEHWKPYEFKWKPGALERKPGWVQPFQPRLDWQMWFAAMASRPPAWFRNFAHRLLQGKPEVLALLDTNPFPDAPPKQIRALLYEYRFSTPEQFARSGQWWTRTLLSEYPPPP